MFPEGNMKSDSRPKRGGWAPGGYIRTCANCEIDFIGGRRSSSCADCAYMECEEDELIDLSLQIAIEAHKGQEDRAGNPYILHPIELMGMVHGVDDKCVALLHDVLEDSEETPKSLIDRGLPYYIVKSVIALTKIKGQEYDDYIGQVKRDEVAVRVKLMDLKHNLDTLRLSSLNENDLKRIAKYHRAHKELEREVGLFG